jgi:hypothetical protein
MRLLLLFRVALKVQTGLCYKQKQHGQAAPVWAVNVLRLLWPMPKGDVRGKVGGASTLLFLDPPFAHGRTGHHERL